MDGSVRIDNDPHPKAAIKRLRNEVRIQETTTQFGIDILAVCAGYEEERRGKFHYMGVAERAEEALTNLRALADRLFPPDPEVTREQAVAALHGTPVHPDVAQSLENQDAYRRGWEACRAFVRMAHGIEVEYSSVRPTES